MRYVVYQLSQQQDMTCDWTECTAVHVLWCCDYTWAVKV